MVYDDSNERPEPRAIIIVIIVKRDFEHVERHGWKKNVYSGERKKIKIQSLK